MVDALRGGTLIAKLAPSPGRPALAALLERVRREVLAPAAPAMPAAGRATALDDAGSPAAGPAAPAAFLRGVSFAMLNRLDGGYHAPAVDARLERLARLGADAVSLMPFAYQGDPHRPDLVALARGPESETDVGLVHAARRAHAHRLRVLWKPQIWVGGRSWTGEIGMTDEADWAAWWERYRRFILHHALVASWARAELFAVGVELDGTAGRAAEWRRLIADVRRIFPGRVVYAANWDRAAEIPFWDALDLVGIDAYRPLAASDRAGPAELAAGARREVDELAALARRAGRPVLLTEVGFAARRGAWMAPHAEGGEYSEADQAAAYRALFAALGRPPWLAGVFVWKAFSGAPDGAATRPDFRFLGRPAAGEIGRYFAAPAGSPRR